MTISPVYTNIPTEEPNWWNGFKADFRLNFEEDGRWHFLTDGLLNTLKITLFALLMGVALGIVVAAVRSSYDKNREAMSMHKGFGYYVFTFINGICKLYLTVIRGTPVMVQLLIMYFIFSK